MSAIRALRQVASPLLARRALCTATPVPRVAGMRVASLASSQALRNPSIRGFASSARRFGEGSTDVALAQKLQEELNYEKETSGHTAGVPEFLKDFEAEGIWKMEDTLGHEEVTLSRKFGNENLRLIVSVVDSSVDEGYGEEENESEEGESTLPSPVHTSLSITKSNGPGALVLDILMQDSQFYIRNVAFYDDAKLGTELTSAADWQRRGLYMGPTYENLDVALQDEMESFLKERGLNESLAQFIGHFADYKEQQEYVQWLTKVKTFVEL